MNIDFSPETLYRLPWSFADNAISWLEPTYMCNLYCDGCYRENRPKSHKSLSVIERELDVFQKNRKTDGVSIAGGEPLTHPNIIDIVKMVKKRGWKPIINSNGALLTKELLHDLKKAGVFGFTFHIDSGQSRQGWKNKNELELNELRLNLAEMLAREGGVSCSFNATIYPETIKYIPELTHWAQRHIDKVHSMVFILYRMAVIGKNIEYYIGNEQVDFNEMMYSMNDLERRTDVKTPEIVELIRKDEPDFMPCAFLNGTAKPDSYKWLLSGRIGNSKQIFGYVGSKFMEIVQAFKHLTTDKYMAYSSPGMLRKGRLYFLLAPFDLGIRNIARNYFKSFATSPLSFFKRVHYQSILIIQPVDIMPNGDANMCDGCPDMTVWNDSLVWSCRMEEQMKWGQNVRFVPKKDNSNNNEE